MVHAGLVWLPGAAPIPAIVEHEHRHVQQMLPRHDAVHAVGDVASVAMHHEEDAAWTRHRAIPPMEAYAILGRKRHILTLEPHGVPITVGIAGGDKDQTLFKHHGAPHEQQRRSHHANGDMKQAPALADHRTSGWW